MTDQIGYWVAAHALLLGLVIARRVFKTVAGA